MDTVNFESYIFHSYEKHHNVYDFSVKDIFYDHFNLEHNWTSELEDYIFIHTNVLKIRLNRSKAKQLGR